jgi:hypothetical protein
MLPQDLSEIARNLRRLNRKYDRGVQSEISAKDLVARAEELVMSRYHVPLTKATPVQLHEAIADAVMLRIAPRWADDAAEQHAEDAPSKTGFGKIRRAGHDERAPANARTYDKRCHLHGTQIR